MLTHNFKVGLVYELPLARQKMLTHGVRRDGGRHWRLSSTHYYASGQPIALSTLFAAALWGRSIHTLPHTTVAARDQSGSFDPSVDNFVVPIRRVLPAAGHRHVTDRLRNATRYNPKVRQFPQLQ